MFRDDPSKGSQVRNGFTSIIYSGQLKYERGFIIHLLLKAGISKKRGMISGGYHSLSPGTHEDERAKNLMSSQPIIVVAQKIPPDTNVIYLMRVYFRVKPSCPFRGATKHEIK